MIPGTSYQVPGYLGVPPEVVALNEIDMTDILMRICCIISAEFFSVAPGFQHCKILPNLSCPLRWLLMMAKPEEFHPICKSNMAKSRKKSENCLGLVFEQIAPSRISQRKF